MPCQAFVCRHAQSLSRSMLAIIGAGAAGLIALEQAATLNLDTVVFEARDRVGGAWQLDPDPGECVVAFDDHGRATATAHGEDAGALTPTAMYEGLRTNVPTVSRQCTRARPCEGHTSLSFLLDRRSCNTTADRSLRPSCVLSSYACSTGGCAEHDSSIPPVGSRSFLDRVRSRRTCSNSRRSVSRTSTSTHVSLLCDGQHLKTADLSGNGR